MISYWADCIISFSACCVSHGESVAHRVCLYRGRWRGHLFCWTELPVCRDAWLNSGNFFPLFATCCDARCMEDGKDIVGSTVVNDIFNFRTVLMPLECWSGSHQSTDAGDLTAYRRFCVFVYLCFDCFTITMIMWLILETQYCVCMLILRTWTWKMPQARQFQRSWVSFKVTQLQ